MASFPGTLYAPPGVYDAIIKCEICGEEHYSMANCSHWPTISPRRPEDLLAAMVEVGFTERGARVDREHEDGRGEPRSGRQALARHAGGRRRDVRPSRRLSRRRHPQHSGGDHFRRGSPPPRLRGAGSCHARLGMAGLAVEARGERLVLVLGLDGDPHHVDDIHEFLGDPVLSLLGPHRLEGLAPLGLLREF